MFKIIHNAVAGGFYRGDYQFLLEGLENMILKLPINFQGLRNMISQCLFTGMTGYTTVKRVISTYEDKFHFEIMKNLWGAEYQTMLEALATAWSETRWDLNPYFMFGVDNERSKYAQTKFFYNNNKSKVKISDDNNRFDDCSIFSATAIQGTFESTVSKIVCIAHGFKHRFSTYYDINLTNNAELLDDDSMRAGWGVMIYIDETMLQRQVAKFPMTFSE